MGRKSIRVKGRDYDASGRRDRADARRERTLDVTEKLFLERGYTATTVDLIARSADVSPATIYKAYAGKSGLLHALCVRALAGVGEVPAQERSNAMRASSEPEQLLAGWGRLLAEVSPRISPLLMLLHDVPATDTEAQRLLEALDDQRLERMADNARSLAWAGELRDGLTLDEVRDILWLATSPELYDLLVRRRGWSVARYVEHVTDMMRTTLLPTQA